jgi:hypothetical protein
MIGIFTKTAIFTDGHACTPSHFWYLNSLLGRIALGRIIVKWSIVSLALPKRLYRHSMIGIFAKWVFAKIITGDIRSNTALIEITLQKSDHIVIANISVCIVSSITWQHSLELDNPVVIFLTDTILVSATISLFEPSS